MSKLIKVVRSKRKDQKGFTLVELMATLGILALIVAIAVPAIGGIMAKAKTSSDNADIALIEKSAAIAVAANIQGEPFAGANTATVGDLIDKGYLDMDVPKANSVLTGAGMDEITKDFEVTRTSAEAGDKFEFNKAQVVTP